MSDTKTLEEATNINETSFSPEKQNRLLYHVSNTLLKVGDVTTIINRATDETIRSMDACVVSIMLYDPEDNQLVLKLIKRSDGTLKQPQRAGFKIGEGIAGLAAEKREIIYVSDLAKSRDFIGKPRGNAHSLVSVPMIYQKDLIGVLNISIKKGRDFTQDEKEFLTIFSTIIAGSIKNSQLVEDIKKENDLLNSVIENSGEGTIVFDNNGKVLVANSYIKEKLGLSKKDMLNITDDLLAKKLGSSNYLKKILHVINNNGAEKSLYDELEITLPSGEKNWFGLITSFIRDEAGNISNTVNLSRNITAEKNLIHAKNDLITTATHELRTPLTAIKGYLSMLKDTDVSKMDEKQIKYIDRAYSSTERLVNLVEDLLSTLKIDENKVSLELIDFNLDDVIIESIRNLKPKAQNKKIEIKYDPDQIFAHGDPVRSKHVIENLLDNAIKYTPSNGMITITVKDQTHNIQIGVKDTGVGIPQKYSSTVFDKFIRVNNPLSVKAGGTGLGLYIAKSLVEKQGGHIWVDSKQKKGTTFYFTIPSSISFNQQNNS